jgi:hypothetical protein|tara:strand:- start:154 stop:450 length:297 start_codon:yes stop_codon:yes gene_type:complete
VSIFCSVSDFINGGANAIPEISSESAIKFEGLDRLATGTLKDYSGSVALLWICTVGTERASTVFFSLIVATASGGVFAAAARTYAEIWTPKVQWRGGV